MNIATLKDILSRVEHLSKEAGTLIMSHRDKSLTVSYKDGASSEASSVVTRIDLLSQQLILKELIPLAQKYNLALLAEEQQDSGERLKKDAFFCIDPLDGTLPFINGLHGFSVSIALVAKNGDSLLGVVYDPVKDIMYSAAKNCGALKNGIPLNVADKSDSNAASTAITDKSFLKHPLYTQTVDALNDTGLHLKTGTCGAALHGCSIADGRYPAYFKFPKKEAGGGSLWDFAASQCICKEAGVFVSDIYGHPVELNRRDSTFLNHKGILYADNAQTASIFINLYKNL